jgi:hypothetical protein
MGVEKFRDLDAAGPPAAAGSPGENLRAAFELVAFCHRLSPLQPRRGVEKRTGPSTEDPPPADAAPRTRRLTSAGTEVRRPELRERVRKDLAGADLVGELLAERRREASQDEAG